MPAGFSIFAKIIPDTSEIDKLQNARVEVKANVKPSSPMGMGGGGEEKKGGIFGGVGGGGGGIGGMMGGIVGGLGIFEILKQIVGFLMSLEPIKVIMELIGTIFKLILMPFALMLMKLLLPILIPLIKLMPYWLKFWQDPIAGLKGIGGIIWDALVGFGEWLVRGLARFFEFMYIEIPKKIVDGLIWLGGAIGRWLSSIPGWIWDKLTGLKDWLFEVGGNIITWIGNLPGLIWDKLQGLGSAIASALSGILGSIGEGLRALPQWIFDKFKSGIAWIMDIGGAIAKAFQSMFNGLVGLLAPILNPLIKVFNWIGSAFAGFINEVSSHLPGNWRVHWKDIPEITAGDVIITDKGEIIRTSPEDYIFATKNPTGAMPKSSKVEVNLIVPGLMDGATLRGIANAIRWEVERVV